MKNRTLPIVCLLILATACEQTLAPLPPAKTAAMGAALDADNTTVQTNEIIGLSGVVPSPCTGESVQFDGRAHIVTATTATDGGFTLNYHFNTQSVSGVGLTTGTKYQISDVLSEDASAVFVPFGATADVTVHYRIVSDGGLDNFLADIVYTFTFPDLSTTYKVQNLRCNG
jgi:hypothetical protein